MKSRASALQMALSDLQAEAVEQKFSDWREFGYRLDETYDKMPIAEAGRLTADDSRARRYVVYDRMVQLLRYVHVPNSRVDLSEMGHVLDVLVEKRGEKEVTLFLHWLRKEGRFDPYMATQLQGVFMVMYPETVEEILSQWLRSNVHPNDVYETLVEVAAFHLRGRGSPELQRKFLRSTLTQWATYMHLYVADGRFKYGNNDMRSLFVRNGPWARDDGSVARLTFLRSVDGMADRVDNCLAALVSTQPDSLQMVLDGWQEAFMHPGEVHRLLFNRPRDRATPDAKEKVQELTYRLKFVMWHHYFDVLNVNDVCDDGDRAKQVVGNTGTAETTDLFQWLRSYSGMEDRADNLLAALASRYLTPLPMKKRRKLHR
ncbi:unnamed protein product [Hyaloperonospora brassicae]|uniref:RxLR effector candidate protein n=1 Tax=Hyaloperonospora brassicae TaxID=162125 RepID=A0AAV0UYP2_HYABA|nr:unnamed protein product [Hyaloperonospora brassicae]